VIGCGLLITKKEIFYTKNGALIGTAFKDVVIAKDGFYPAVCIQSLSHHIQSNFGRMYNESPFLFDLDGFC
jgi:Ran-binding protein 9/10